MDVKIILWNGNIHKYMYMTQPEGLRNLPTKYASYKNPFMDLNKLQRVGIYVLMRKSNNLNS